MTVDLETKQSLRARITAIAAMAMAMAFVLLVAACAGTAPPLRLYQLRALPPVARATASPAFNGTLLLGPVDVPEYLNRSTIVTRSGAAGLELKDGHRWAEPLPDAFARVLAQSLAARLGAERVWTLPLPATVLPTRQVRVELLRFDADAGGRSVVLMARWAIVDPRAGAGAPAPAVHVGEWRADVTAGGEDVDALVAAHSVALARLADAIAAALAGAPPASAGNDVNRLPIRDTRASG